MGSPKQEYYLVCHHTENGGRTYTAVKCEDWESNATSGRRYFSKSPNRQHCLDRAEAEATRSMRKASKPKLGVTFSMHKIKDGYAITRNPKP